MNTPFLVQYAPPLTGICAVVYAASYQGPLEALEELERQLSASGVSGTVLFDLLLFQGSRNNRYFAAEFDGHGLQDLCASLGSNTEQFSRVSAAFLAENFDALDAALLSKASRYAVKNGIPL